MQRLGASGRSRLTYLDQGQRQALGQIAQEFALRPGQIHRAEAKLENRDTLSALRARRQYDGALVHDGHGFAGRIQAGAGRELTIMHAAGDHMEALLGRIYRDLLTGHLAAKRSAPAARLAARTMAASTPQYSL